MTQVVRPLFCRGAGMSNVIPQNSPRIHIRFDGRSWDLALVELDLGALASDDDVRAALARHFDVPVAKFRAYVVERHDNGNMTVRPEAVFG
jgi:hypothetical protein